MTVKKKPKRVIRRSPRVQVTLTPEGMALLTRLAKATGQRKGTLLGELLEEAMPALELSAKALEIVRVQPREAQRLMSNFGAEAVAKLSQQQLAFDQEVTAKLDGRTVKARRQKGRARGPT